ncbi:putative transmembrane protein [Curvibacter phage PCA1]|nr:putative transmembrane protein [Curvibacter phage PCA1]
MPILSQDIKLLKSAVMADTTDGGGAMTGVAVVDGQSNNLFPDTSAMDRAFGRVNLRKLFGVAHTSDTDTLLGAHAIITEAPADLMVNCSLLKTNGWADSRASARDVIEKYLVKGPKASARIYDTHYAGSLQLRLYSFTGNDFPSGGDAMVIRNPNGVEQYVRVLRVSVAVQNVAVSENSNVSVLPINIATCELGQELAMDVLGPPAARVISESLFAVLYTTTVASGAKFYGIKPLGTAGQIGDYSVTTSGGIYNALVPAATVESPLTDQYPLNSRSSLIDTSLATVTLPAVSTTFTASTVLTTPTAITPGSLVVTVDGAAMFTDTGDGSPKNGLIIMAEVDYKTGRIAGVSTTTTRSGSIVISYLPAAVVGASANSAALKITTANQGLSYTAVFDPLPAPGSFTLSYMAQGRWYALQDNMAGKLSGSDSGYGVGTLNYVSGSMALTLGAIPDIGSSLIADWGDRSSAIKAQLSELPTKLAATLALPERAAISGVQLSWKLGNVDKTATSNAQGVFSGDATGSIENGVVNFTPNQLVPTGTVVKSVVNQVATASTAISGSGGAYQANANIVPGTFRGSIIGTWPSAATGIYGTQSGSNALAVWDSGGVLYASIAGPVGTINYTSGAITMNQTASVYMVQRTETTSGSTWGAGGTTVTQTRGNAPIALGGLTGVSYASGTTGVVETNHTVSAWRMTVATGGESFVQSGAVFTIGGELYSTAIGVVRRGWNTLTGPGVPSAGSSDSLGNLLITSVASGVNNSVTWQSASYNNSPSQVYRGVFRTKSAPLKTGVFQMQAGFGAASANDAGVISGSGFTGTVDTARGIVTWSSLQKVDPSLLSFNAVFLQFLPLDPVLLGMDTARLPLDGKVPIYRSGDLVVVHNTLSLQLPNPLVKGDVYPMGRTRLASVRVKDALGVTVPDTLYVTNLDPGTVTFPINSVLTAYAQPFTVEHRIEDLLLCSSADISGQLKFTRSLTHAFPAGSSFVSSAIPFGDLFARTYAVFEQATWTSEWRDTIIGSPTIPQYNTTQFPIAVTNRGAIKERWLLLFTGTSSFRIIGESVGEIGTGNTGSATSPINPATNTPYFTVDAAGWGSGWVVGNCLRFNTDACGTPLWAVRTVLQGPASVESDKFTLAFRGDVDRP